MQPRRVVLLDHEPPLLRWRYPDVAGRLVGLFEIAFLSIGGKALEHDRSCDCRATVIRNENPRQPFKFQITTGRHAPPRLSCPGSAAHHSANSPCCAAHGTRYRHDFAISRRDFAGVM